MQEGRLAPPEKCLEPEKAQFNGQTRSLRKMTASIKEREDKARDREDQL